MNRFEDAVVMVAGGARGIGFAIAAELARQGATLAILDAPRPMSTLDYATTTPDELQAAVEKLRADGAACTGHEVDVRDRTAVAEVVQRCVAELGRVDALVDCAGVGGAVDADAMTDAAWSEVVDTNLHGFYNLVRALTGHLVAQGSGNVLAVVGDEGRRGTAGMSHLSAAGWAVIGLAKSLALETAEAGVAVNVLCVGPVDTALASSSGFRAAAADSRDPLDGQDAVDAMGARHPNGQPWVPMDDVVRAACFLLASGTSSTGSVLDVSAGLSALNSS